MATYKSDRVGLAYPAEQVFGKVSNLEGLGDIIKNAPADSIPADQRAMLEGIKVTPDTISFPAGPVGEITLRRTHMESPSLIELEGENTPVPMHLSMHIIPTTSDTCEAYVEIDIAIPAMLKPMVNGPLQKMADQFAQMLRQLPMK